MRCFPGVTGAALCLLPVLSGCGDWTGDREAAPDSDLRAGVEAEPAVPPPAYLPEGVTEAQVSEGRRLFLEMGCHACHGNEGRGTQLGPSLADGDWIGISGERSEIARVIAVGVPRPREHPTAMPAAGAALDSAEVSSLAAYVQTLAGGDR